MVGISLRGQMLAALAFAFCLTMGGAAVAQTTYFPGAGNRISESRAGHGEFSLTYQNRHFR